MAPSSLGGDPFARMTRRQLWSPVCRWLRHTQGQSTQWRAVGVPRSAEPPTVLHARQDRETQATRTIAVLPVLQLPGARPRLTSPSAATYSTGRPPASGWRSGSLAPRPRRLQRLTALSPTAAARSLQGPRCERESHDGRPAHGAHRPRATNAGHTVKDHRRSITIRNDSLDRDDSIPPGVWRLPTGPRHER